MAASEFEGISSPGCFPVPDPGGGWKDALDGSIIGKDLVELGGWPLSSRPSNSSKDLSVPPFRAILHD